MRLTIKTPADLAVAAPVLLGFEPHDSLVVLSIGPTPPGGKGGPHLRIDHPHHPAAMLETASTIGEISARHATDSTVWALVSYTADQNTARDTILAIAAMLTGTIGPVLQVTTTTAATTGATTQPGEPGGVGARWIDHSDLLDPESDPQTPRDLHAAGIITRPHGTITQADRDRVLAAAALEGRPAPAPTRAAAGAHLQPSDSEEAAHATVADLIAHLRTDRLALRLDVDHAQQHQHEQHEAAWMRQQITTWRQQDHQQGPGARLDDQDVARLAVNLPTPALRDVVLASLTRESALVDHDLWAAVARRVPEQEATVPLLFAGFTAWLHGHGALAWIAYDRAQDLNPTDVSTGAAAALAGILRDFLTQGVPPTAWDRLVRALATANPEGPEAPGGSGEPGRSSDPEPAGYGYGYGR